MTLNELKYIVALAKQRHFRKASEVCFVSQPTLSIAIKKFEQELGITLFERHKSEIIITPVGEEIIRLAEDILQKSQLIKQIAQEEQGDHSGELRVGAIYTIAPYLLPKLIPEFHQLAPKIPFILQENYTVNLIDKLRNGELDVAILSLPFSDPHIETLELYEEPFVVALPNDHHLANKSKLSLVDLEQETLLLLGAGHCFRDQVVDAFPNLNHLNLQTNQLQRTLEGSSLETIRFMVGSGAGITILPCSSLNTHDADLFTVKEIESTLLSRTVVLAWRKSFPRKQVLETLKLALNNIQIACTIKKH
ncbi:MAG: hydrogen peroxide-inducible genes activator [Thiomicrospira sp.]|uniref:hydrogen peroxide-inducible genes activator n=1 Tax=Thiomicrospira sp. TaxID=935 RepID=UPI0019E8E02D|nr:hydrogen peroxide-inducible genes activator [Thiomicrospira sp.]MBE0493462.1 hydrogen peroxide-inducible genes activator [Thiomicrospira sp.]